MRSIAIVGLAGSLAVACSPQRPDEATCEQVADAMVRIFSADNEQAGPAGPRMAERQHKNFAHACLTSATKKQAACTIAAQSVQDLEDCE
jgi:hypothetical protein